MLLGKEITEKTKTSASYSGAQGLEFWAFGWGMNAKMETIALLVLPQVPKSSKQDHGQTGLVQASEVGVVRLHR